MTQNAVLLLDTTQDVLLMALLLDGDIHYFKPDGDKPLRRHASILVPSIAHLLADYQLQANALSGIAVNIGPGSFTGIRTGLTVARTLAQFSQAACYALDTFSLLAAAPPYRDKTVRICLNAYRQQHYAATLRVQQNGQIVWSQQPVVQANSAYDTLECDTYLVEEGLIPLLAPLPSTVVPCTPRNALNQPEIESMAFFLLSSASQFTLTDWRELQPNYLQLPSITPSKKQGL